MVVVDASGDFGFIVSFVHECICLREERRFRASGGELAGGSYRHKTDSTLIGNDEPATNDERQREPKGQLVKGF